MKRSNEGTVKHKLDLSNEQIEIVEFASRERICDPFVFNAHAGCGKTTLLYELAETRYNKGFGWMLLISYSSGLKSAGRVFAEENRFIQVESIHSLVANVLWPGHECTNDNHITDYVNLKHKPVPNTAFLEHISMVAMDEMQDLNCLYILVIQQLRSFFVNLSIVGCGEVFQWLFGSLHKSSIDFMCYPDKYFEGEKKPFVFFCLTKSFRLTHETCEWINTFLNPNTIEDHYPECWLKYGDTIKKFWKQGLSSARCVKCACIHNKKDPDKCTGNYNSTTIQMRKVSLMGVHKYSDPLIPKTMVDYVTKNNVMLLINGRSQSKYQRYPLVSTPFKDKGLSFEQVGVIGFDSKTEERLISASLSSPENEMLSIENWPLAAYCMLYVSCTRARQRLFVFHDSSSQLFFTARKKGQLSIQTMISACITFNNSRLPTSTSDINRLFEFVPQEPYLDSMVRAVTLAEEKQSHLTLTDTPDSAPGIITHTLVTNFAKYYHRAVIAATFLFCARDMKITNYTMFMRKCILNKNQNSAIHPTWLADNTWCENATEICVSLFNQLAPGSLVKKKDKFIDLKSEAELCPRFAWAGLSGDGGIVTAYGSLYVSFDIPQKTKPSSFAASFDTTVDESAKLAHHRAIANCIGYTNAVCPRATINCFNLNPFRRVLQRIELRQDANYFIGELLRRKKWHSLLKPEFSISQLALRNDVPLSASKHQEAIKSLSLSASLSLLPNNTVSLP